jgi:acetolactate synthase small subunit
MAGTDRWYAQMTKVTNSDPQLQQMAANLGDLYGVLRLLQKQQGKLEAQELVKKVRR